ncbi:MAG: UDP-glucose dehydrogenase family protein [Bacteroidota bacterium]
MNIAVVGTGYVGLVGGTCFADSGNNVTCVDIDEEKVQQLRDGIVPIYEPGLETIFKRSIRENRLHFTTNLEDAIESAEIIFLSLPTPPGANGQADLSAVIKVAGQLGNLIKDYKIIVNKSTVPVGTADKVHEAIAENATVDFDVVSNPEFLREGAAVEDFMKPERVVIGSSSERAIEKMQVLYEPFVRSGNPIIVMDERSAEMTKYAANAMLATKITFMNEIANVCERVGANVDHIRRGIGTDSRIGKRFLFAGIGYGGSCFPKDVQAIHHTAGEYGYDFRILDSVMRVNDQQKLSIVEKVKQHFNSDLDGKTFGVWGLSFKPETDDIREAPSLYITKALAEAGVQMKAYDPEALLTFQDAIDEKTNQSITYVDEQGKALEGVDALIICTEWNEFRRPNFDRFKTAMKEPLIFDGRNLYDLKRAKQAGLKYISVGRPSVNI